MIPSLAPCFEGSLAPWHDRLVLEAGEGEAMPGTALLDPERTRDLVARFAATYPGADLRGVVSMWTQWYFGALAVPAAAALLVAERSLPVALGEVQLVFHGDGRPRAILLRDEGEPCGPPCGADTARDRLAALVDDHAEPLIRHVAAEFRVAPKLLWCNLATILDWTMREIGPRAAPASLAACRRRLGEPTCPDGRRNPMCGAVTETGACGTRCRRICCLRYLLPGTPGCGDLCPLPEVSGRVG